MTLPNGSRIAVLLFGILTFPTATHGQTPSQEALGCVGYENCALRIRYRIRATEIVQGRENTQVARIGLGTPPLGELLSRSDQGSLSFDRFRVDHKRSSVLTILGGIEIIGGLVARAQEEDDWAMALSISGIIFEVAGTIFKTRADEHLSEAIWWYNQSLTQGGVR